MSLRSERSSWVFSTWPVCLRRRRLQKRFADLAELGGDFAVESSLISLAFMMRIRVLRSDNSAFAHDEPAVEGELCVGEAEGFLCDARGMPASSKSTAPGLMTAT